MSAAPAPRVLIVRGGWPGHEPVETSDVAARELRAAGAEVEIADTLDALADEARLRALDLIVPVWTMGDTRTPLPRGTLAPLAAAVRAGTGIGGWHGGMCDAFRIEVEYQFMTGGQWVSHPGGDKARYRVRIGPAASPITAGLADFSVTSEQYYMHVDPGVTVLATTRFPRGAASGDGLDQAAQDAADRDEVPVEETVVMPVTWTKRFGRGRVFYTSLGHVARAFEVPEALTMLRRDHRAADSSVGASWGTSKRCMRVAPMTTIPREPVDAARLSETVYGASAGRPTPRRLPTTSISQYSGWRM
ncbi:MAG TPA: ThuA domain-containing protein [Chloroflexota bacterium]|nr:ThuA domain-containing protein [Chloroflexota bacterium]